MSRIGSLPVPLASGVQATLDGGALQIAGPLGTLEQTVAPRLSVVIDQARRQVRVERKADDRQTKALHGLTRNLIANMVKGVAEGYVRGVQVVGVGYSAKLQGKKVILEVGFSHPVEIDVPDSVTIDAPQTGNMLISGVGSVACTTLRVRGVDKQAVGEFAARLRRVKPPEPYKAKGIRYEGEEIRRKAGKAFAAQE